MDRVPYLGAELRRILSAMYRDGVLHRGVYQFLLIVGRYGDGAFHLAREFPAVDIFACHLLPPAGQRS